MTEKEALNVMTQAREDAGQVFLGKVQFNVPQYHAVIKALGKQIPKKCLIKRTPNTEIQNFYCPACGEVIISKVGNEWLAGRLQNYCDNCGQALEWGNDE